MKWVDSNVYRDLAKVCLDVAKYVLTGAILAPFFSGFDRNSVAMYLVGAGIFLVVLISYGIFNILSKKEE
jgi:hypothetical protein